MNDDREEGRSIGRIEGKLDGISQQIRDLSLKILTVEGDKTREHEAIWKRIDELRIGQSNKAGFVSGITIAALVLWELIKFVWERLTR